MRASATPDSGAPACGDAVVPTEVVTALVARVEGQLASLRNEIAGLESQADAVEHDLRTHLAGVAGYDGLERDVVRRLASWLDGESDPEAPPPRTTVVNRPALPATDHPAPSSWPAAAAALEPHDAASGGLLARIPATILVRLGVVVVVAALLLLKLG